MQTYMNCSLNLSYLILSYLILSYLILSYLILSYLILSYLILSYLILSYHLLRHLFFCLHNGCRIKYFLSLAFYSYCIFQCQSLEKSKRSRACLIHLLLLVRLVCLSRVARQIKVSSHGSACFTWCCSPCRLIQ
jgi:hypothetical protein